MKQKASSRGVYRTKLPLYAEKKDTYQEAETVVLNKVKKRQAFIGIFFIVFLILGVSYFVVRYHGDKAGMLSSLQSLFELPYIVYGG